MDFLVLYTIRPIAITAILRQKKAPSKRVLDVWSESVARAGRKINFIAQVPVDCIHNPDIKNAGQVLVDPVAWCVVSQSDINPVS